MLALLPLVAAVNLAPVTDLINAVEAALWTAGIPLGVIGIMVGAIMTWMGFQAGTNTMRVAIITLVVAGLAKGLAAAFFGG